MDYKNLNALVNIYNADCGKVDFDSDKEAARQYFLQHVNQNTVFFHSLEEKLDYLVTEGYYDKSILDMYDPKFLKRLWKATFAHKFRFESFLGAYKYYTSYTLKTRDGKRYLERYEDRVVMNALTLARGDVDLAVYIMEEIITGRFQPATPTFLNAGKKARGELVSCFLLRIEDNMESVGRAINSALQLSKRGGGVSLLLTNLREAGAPIKGIESQSSGVVPVMKILEDSFSYANQLGARQGAGAVYLNAHHPDIISFLDTKRENADEKIRIKTLSLGVVIPDITFQLAREDKNMHLFSPYDVQKVYGKSMSDISISEHYEEMVNNPDIRKKEIPARQFFQLLADIQFQSGYPYIMFEDTVNRANPIDGHINMSNLCSEILQINTPSALNSDISYAKVGEDISCNLGSLNIAKVMENGHMIHDTVNCAVRALTAVSDISNLECVPSIANGNAQGHAIGLGQMNLHGFLAREGIAYDSPEAIDFTNVYFAMIRYHVLQASSLISYETKVRFDGFEKSKYARGEFFDYYTENSHLPETKVVTDLFAKYNVRIPTRADWFDLKISVMTYGLYHRNQMAVAPTGSISYINHSTSSIHPIAARIEVRKEGKTGRVYYPAPYITNENRADYRDAYEIGWKPLIDVYAAATKHVDQGCSLTLFFPAEATTRDINQAQIYAWRKGIKTIYYIRLRQKAIAGTEVASCVSCAI